AAVAATGLSGLKVSELGSANGALYFVAGPTNPGPGSDNVYKLDPAAPGGVAPVTQFSPNQGFIDLEAFSGRLYFTQSAITGGAALPATQALYTVSGTSETRLTTFAGSNGIATLAGAVALNGKLYFTANDYAPAI